MKSRFVSVLFLFLFLFPLMFTERANAVTTFKVAHAVNPSNPYHLGVLKFIDLVTDKTHGGFKFDVYPSGQLGNERDLIEGLQMGTVDMVVTSTGPMSNFISDFGALDLPYLFESRDDAYEVLDGEIGRDLLRELEPIGIKGLAFWENGFRCITNSKKPIKAPADLKGLKIRTMENPVQIETFKVLGASPIPMAWSEVYVALQQGTIDGQENPIPIVYNEKIYEVQRYLSITDHFYSPALILMSKRAFDRLTDEEREIFLQSATEAGNYERSVVKKQTDEYINILKDAGVEINYPDKTAFVRAVGPVYTEYEKNYGPLVKKIKGITHES